MMVILGAGIAGTAAKNYFSRLLPSVFDKRKAGEKSCHEAIMRIRDFRLGYLLGNSLKEIRVSKYVYYDGNYYDKISPALQNQYSFKVAGSFRERSIINLEPVTRYIMDGELSQSEVVWDCELNDIRKGLVSFKMKKTAHQYDVIISTIPLPNILEAVGIPCERFEGCSRSIHVNRYGIVPACEIYQTVYYPSLEMGIYRASIDAGELIIESMNVISEDEEEYVFKSFGLHPKHLVRKGRFVQELGKIFPIMEDSFRKWAIMELTERYNIYSLGRFATWRNLTTDDIIPDIKKIDALLNMSEESRKYSTRLL